MGSPTGDRGVVETHVSVLIFSGGRVLKFKKPVRFPFLDFTDRQARLHACQEEVAANRRHSPDVYLGVADLVLDPGAPGSTYSTLLARARVALALGQSVILDATFVDDHQRRAAETLARQTANRLVVVCCQVPEDVAAARVRARLTDGADVPGADERVLRAMARMGSGTPWAGAAVIDTAGSLEDEMACALRAVAPAPVAYTPGVTLASGACTP